MAEKDGTSPDSTNARPDSGPPASGTHPEHAGLPADALYSPDDPIAGSEGEIPPEAIFSPDDPISLEEVVEGVVTGIGGSAERPPTPEGDLAWQIQHVAHTLRTLSKALREEGIAALKLRPDTEPMDAVLRSFIAGYLVGRTDLGS